MQVHLQQPPTPGELTRYVRLTLQPDLFGNWELITLSGQLTGRSQLRRQLFTEAESAQQAFQKACEAQQNRGFQIISSPEI